MRSSQSELFVNWHPAPLGHEVIGHQIAFYHLKMMRIAVEKILSGLSVDDFIAGAATPPLPKNTQCRDSVCKFDSKCAYSFLPKEEGPDVGDWMVNNTNKTKKRWVNAVVDNQKTCNRAGGFKNERTCSYKDQKRGMRGEEGAKITLQFKDLFYCKIWIGETNYEWSKPLSLANWQNEMLVRVNNKTCTHCKAYGFGQAQMLEVDARGMFGGGCRHMSILVDIELLQKNHTCSSSCENEKVWRGYKNFCRKNKEGKCFALDRKKIHTFISYAISF